MAQFNESVISNQFDFTKLNLQGKVWGYTDFTQTALFNQTMRLSIETADAKLAVAVTVDTTSDLTHYQVFEDSTIAGGDIITAANLNRNFKNNPLPVANGRDNPTIVLGGDLFADYYIVGGTGGLLSGRVPQAAGSPTIVLAPNTSYVFDVTNEGGSTVDYFTTFLFAEVK